MRSAFLAALWVIVEVVTASALSAVDRRQTVATYQNQLLTQYAFPRAPFETALRDESFWTRFQQTLREAERTDIPSLGQQLESFRNAVPISIGDLSIATGRSGRAIHQRTIERHRDGAPMGPASIRRYQETLSELLGQKIAFVLPSSAPRRRRTGKKPVKRR